MMLRKVFFKEETDGFLPDEPDEERMEREKEAEECEGFLHCWIPSMEHNAELGREMPCVCALVEDLEGNLHEVAIKNVRFQEPITVNM